MRASIEFKLLGPLEVTRDGAALDLGGRRQRSLLALLLLHANRVVPRERLIDALWGEEPPPTAANSLQVAVHELRKTLGHDRVRSANGGYAIIVEDGELDLAEFERARHADPVAALALWRGAAANDAYPDAVRRQLARLDELRLATFETRVERDLAEGRSADAVPELEAAVREHPFREGLRAQLIRALYASGRQADALAAYADARRALVEDLGIEPSAELRDLHARVLRQDPALAPAPLPALAGRGLPTPPNPLIGRRLELAAVTGLLAIADVRLLTITGPGGTGKTRIALAAADELRPGFADGAHFVDLAPLSQPELVPSAIARAVGVGDAADEAPALTLQQALRHRNALLVVDNFEHVLDAAPVLADLLAAAPRVKVLATSRAALRVAAEHEYPLFPLELPPASRAADPAALEQNEAVALFVARARAVRPDWRLDTDNGPAVAGICTALDGLPLALELAAARMKALSPDDLLRRLRERPDALAAGARDLPERQRTLRATIDWSCELLREAERTLFARLAVFAGGFTLDAAEEVAGASVESVAALVDNSLVIADGSGRFRMLETIRQRAAERLDEARETASRRRAHAEFFLALAEEQAPRLRGPEAEAALDVLESEHDNLRAALAFARDCDSTEIQLRLSRALHRFWYLRGHLSEGRAQLEAALAASRPQPPRLRGLVLDAAGALAWRQGRLDEAEQHASAALELLEQHGDDRDRLGPVSTLSVVAMDREDFDRARPLVEEMTRLARELGDRYGLAVALNNRGYVAWVTKDVDDADAAWTECLAVARAGGTDELAALALSGLGDVALARGMVDEAVVRFGEALALHEKLGFTELIAVTCVCLALAAAKAGEAEWAARLLGAADALQSRTGSQQNVVVRGYAAEATDYARAQLGDDSFTAAFDAGRAGPDDVVAEALSRTSEFG